MSIAGGPDIVENGLVLHLDAADLNSYPGTGTLWTDLSGNGNNGTLTNGPAYSSNNNGSIVFDGTNDYVDCGNSSTFNNTSITVMVFFKFTSTPLLTSLGVYMLVAKNYGTGTDESFAIWWYGAAFDGLNAGSWHATVYQDHTTGFQETPIVNQWYCMTQTFDNITKISNLYKNGLLMSSKTLAGKTILYDTKLLSIGMELQNNVNNFFFPGHIPQVLIYNRALSASEVLQNYNAIKGRYGL